MTRARKNKPPQTPGSSITYGDFYRGTNLRRRFERHQYEVAPEYFGDSNLSLCDRLLKAFAEADKCKVEAVVVDGVLYPKLDGKWYKWARPRETYELFLREAGLPEPEIFFRLSVQRLEDAKNDLLLAFNWKVPTNWESSLKLCKGMAKTPKNKRRIMALENAISARDIYHLRWESVKESA